MKSGLVWTALAVVLMSAPAAHAAPDNLFENFGPVVQILHLYSGADGKSHLEPMPVPEGKGPVGMTTLFAAPSQSFTIAYWPDGFQSAWHYAVHTNVIFYLQGTQIIDLGDGVEHRLTPGVVVLADDWTGQGHRFRCEAKTGKHACVVVQATLGELKRELPLKPAP